MRIILPILVFHLSQNCASAAVFRLRDSPLSHFVTRETLEVSTAIQAIYVFSVSCKEMSCRGCHLGH